ncbi:MAG TPA: flagellar basal body-associated FliL family protein [Rhizobacter sp.]|nr:flagellar basal body-associated FliL family protein [Rhizobacter sp.]
MATAAAEVPAEAAVDDAAPKRGKKKLIIIIASAVLLVSAIGGGVAYYMIKKKAAAVAAEAQEDGDVETVAAPVEKEKKKHDSHKKAPTFVPLEPFTVNLADKESDRFAQIGITLEVDEPKFAEELKAYMPAIRNGILMVLSHKTSQQLLSREGKLALAREIMRESVLPLGIEVSEQDDSAKEDDDKSKKEGEAGDHNPVTHVHFSNFIVQ